MRFVHSGEKIPDAVQNRYNQPDIKNALKEEAKSKCMYCESPIGHIAYEHIEHYRPKAANKYPELTFEWTNLGLACPVCNLNKKDEFDENCTFINPYLENPDDSFIALGHFIYHKPNNPRAELTEKLIGLNRPELIERRKERIDTIRGLIDLYAKESNPTLKKILEKELDIETDIDKPYCMCVKSVVKAMK
jgi:hypothetical protein